MYVLFVSQIENKIEDTLREKFTIEVAQSTEDAIHFSAVYNFDIIVLSTSQNEISTLPLIRTLRIRKVETPIVVVSDISKAQYCVKCLESGADDFIRTPYIDEELIARIYAIVRRSHGYSQSIIEFGDLTINLNTKNVSINDKKLQLPVAEYRILELLFLHKGKTVSKELIINHLYGGRDEPKPQIVNVHVSRIRKKMTQGGSPMYIKTVWGRGFVLDDTNSTC